MTETPQLLYFFLSFLGFPLAKMYFLLYNLCKSGEKWLIVVNKWVKVVDF